MGRLVPASLADKQTNEEILTNLVDKGNLDIASERCLAMFNVVRTAEEKVHLLQQLKSISISIGDKKQLAWALTELLQLKYE